MTVSGDSSVSKNYMSQEFLKLLHDFGYEREETPPRDKHANGRAERTVGVVEVKINTTMLHTSVPQAFWDLAMIYTCHIHAFNPHSRTGMSPYTYVTGQPVDINELHPFWCSVYFFIPPKDRLGKSGLPSLL
jgi:hypothetical protein